MHLNLLSLFSSFFIVNTAQLIDQLKSYNKEGGDSVILYRLPFTNKKVFQLGKATPITTVDNNVLSNDGFIIHPFNYSGRYYRRVC